MQGFYIFYFQLFIFCPELLAKQSISDWKNIYLSECEDCELKKECAGFFASSENKHSEYIKSIK
jgi:hypothetical protein